MEGGRFDDCAHRDKAGGPVHRGRRALLPPARRRAPARAPAPPTAHATRARPPPRPAPPQLSLLPVARATCAQTRKETKQQGTQAESAAPTVKRSAAPGPSTATAVYCASTTPACSRPPGAARRSSRPVSTLDQRSHSGPARARRGARHGAAVAVARRRGGARGQGTAAAVAAPLQRVAPLRGRLGGMAPMCVLVSTLHAGL